MMTPDRRFASWRLAAGLLAAIWSGALRADYAMAARDADGMRDVMLCYASAAAWTVPHFRPYVAYLDPQTGQPRDWFFDAWLMLQYGGAPSGAAYIDGPTTKADWESFLDAEWAPGRNLAALDECIGQTGAALGEPVRPHPVILMLPYPSPKQTAFGELTGDGTAADLSRPADRQRTVEWFVDEAIRRWQATPRQHLRLWGFYWMNEGIHPADHDIVRHMCSYVHGKGLKTYWIPWFQAPGYDRWRDLGFDVAVMQPNFAFVATPPGLRLGDVNRLSVNALRARDHGLGVEMEMSDAAVRSAEGRWNLAQYLNHGVPELDGYMAGVARAWYQSSDLIRRLAESPNPESRQLYDDIYRFHQGTYARRPWSLAEGRPVRIATAGRAFTVAALTDGLWDTQGGRADDKGGLDSGDARLAVDLGQIAAVSNLRLHLRDSAVLEQVEVRTSRDGLAWEAAEATEVAAGRAGAGLAFRMLSLRPVLARHLELALHWQAGVTLGMDEVLVPPDGNVLWDCRSTARGPSVTWALDVPRVLRCLRVGPFAVGEGAMASARIDAQELPDRAIGPDGWAEWLLPAVPARQITCTFQGGTAQPAVAGLAIPARNAALQCPYALAPSFPAKYPDSNGCELTDGILSEAGFADGRTVGWYGVAPTVILDLGRELPVERLRIHAQGEGYAAVNFPSTIDLAAAGDDGAWRLLTPRFRPLAFAVPADAPATRRLGWAECGLGAVKARRLRLRLGTAQGGWTMLSEVEVSGPDGNPTTPAAYLLQPAPSSDAKYSDNNGYLTDGTYSGSAWNGCAGWNAGTPEITVDLQQEAAISLVVVHLVGGGAGGVFFPEQVAVRLSSDGSAWLPAGIADGLPDDRGGRERRTGTAMLRLDPPRPARHLQVTLQRRGWAMVHEVEAY